MRNFNKKKKKNNHLKNINLSKILRKNYTYYFIVSVFKWNLECVSFGALGCVFYLLISMIIFVVF